MNIFKRLLGRAEMALNTFKHHPDRHARDDSHIRAKAYFAALDDVKDDEQIKAGMHLAWMFREAWESGQVKATDTVEQEAFQRAVDDLNKTER